MPYCDLSDVQNLNPKRTYSATTTPTTTQVNAMIDLIASDIDMLLEAKGYTNPATTPTAFVNWLKLVNALGSAAMAEDAMFPETVEKGSTPHASILRKQYMERLNMLKSGEISPDSIGGDDVSSFYHVMSDRDAFPEPKFRKRDSDLEF